ncbi:MAG: hypothetical protein IT423_17795, partial [Pirellulaceae bacterium]|nr:hypothetical protein [Pirellulaceae bacterium]
MSLQFYHFSVDDVLNCLLEISEAAPFQQPLMQFYKQLNDLYGAPVDLYLFYRLGTDVNSPSLSDVPSGVRSWLLEAPWLRFGPHAVDPSTPPHSQTVAEQLAFCEQIYANISRLAGGNSKSQWLRFHYFSECYELADYLSGHGVTTLLTTDKPATSYRLPANHTQQLGRDGITRFNNINFVRSHIRIENLLDVENQELDAHLDRLTADASCAV